MLHFEIPRKELINPLKLVTSVVEQRQTLVILGNILVSVQNSLLTLTGTDSEVEIVCSIPLENSLDNAGDGAITLPAKKFFDIVRSLPDRADIQLHEEEGKALIKYARSRFSLGTLPAEDFPSAIDVPDMVSVTIEKSKFREMLAQTSYCMGVQDVRYYLNGLLLDLKESKFVTVATDGHRLALAEILFEYPEGQEPLPVIVPRKAIIELQRMLEAADDEIVISLDRQHVKFKLSDNLMLSSKLIDGRFPDYMTVVPHNTTKSVVARVDEFKQALTRVAILSNEKYKGVRLTFKPNMLTISARNPDQEEAEEEVEVTYNGDEFEIGFNAQYLLDALAALPSKAKEVELRLSDINSSCLMLPWAEDGDSSDYHSVKYVIMPMRL